MEKVNLLGIQIGVVDHARLLEEIDRLASLDRPALVNNVNVYACNIACTDPHFLDILNDSELVYCDGFGVKLGAYLLGESLGERMTPPDWIDDLLSLSVRRGYRLYLLGDTDEVVSRFRITSGRSTHD